MVEWLSMLCCIQKVVVSVIGPETEWGILIFLHPLQAVMGVVPKGTCKMEPT
jgi:hypothetical protein